MRKIIIFMLLLILHGFSYALTFLPDLAAAATVSIVAFALGILMPINKVPKRVLSLESMAWLAIGAYSLAVPLHHIQFNDYNDWSIRIALRICILSAIGFAIGAFLFGAWRKIPNSLRQPREADWNFYYRAGWLLVAWGVLVGILSVGLTVGFDAYFSAGYAGRVLVKREAGPIELGLYHAVVGIIVIMVAKLSMHNEKKSILAYALLGIIICLFFSYVTFLGIRRPNYFLIISIIFVYSIAGPGYSKAKLAIVFMPFALAFAMFSNFRQVLSDQGFAETIAFTRENFSLQWFDFSKSELGAAFRALLDVIETWGEDPLRWGFTFLQAPVYMLPSSFGIQTESLSQEYTRRNFTSEYFDIGGNMGFFPAAEGYINFGSIGVLIYFILLAGLVCRIERKAIEQSRPIDLIYYAIAAPWIAFFIRTDFSSFTKVFLYSVVAPLLMLYGLKLLQGRKKRTSTRRGNIHQHVLEDRA